MSHAMQIITKENASYSLFLTITPGRPPKLNTSTNTQLKPDSHMSQMIGESLSVIIQGENSQRSLLKSDYRQWLSQMSATYEALIITIA